MAKTRKQHVPRRDKVRKRTLIKSAAKYWTPWEEVPITEQMRSGHPLLRNCHAIYRNSRYEVQVFHCSSAIGGVAQMTAIRHGDLEEITWEELQRIVHERFGEDAVAVEVYPRLQDALPIHARVRVLWVLPAGWELPFGLHLPTSWGKPA